MLTGNLPTSTCGAYFRYIEFAELFMKNIDTMALLRKMTEMHGTQKVHSISQLNSQMLCTSIYGDNLLTSEAVNYFVNSPIKAASFMPQRFTMPTTSVLTEIYELSHYPRIAVKIRCLIFTLPWLQSYKAGRVCPGHPKRFFTSHATFWLWPTRPEEMLVRNGCSLTKVPDKSCGENAGASSCGREGHVHSLIEREEVWELKENIPKREEGPKMTVTKGHVWVED